MFDAKKSLEKRKKVIIELEIVSKSKYFSRLRELGIYSYSQYLNSEYWKNIKKRMSLSKTPKECFCCGDSKKLEIHHRKYKARDIDKANLNHFVYLCRNCHEEVHSLQKEDKTITINQATKRIRILKNQDSF